MSAFQLAVKVLYTCNHESIVRAVGCAATLLRYGAAQTSHRFPHIDVVASAPVGTACTVANALEQYRGDVYTCDPTSLTWRLPNSSHAQNLPSDFATQSAVNPQRGSFSSVSAGSTNGVLHPTLCGSSTPPSWCSGSDIGAWVNAAGASCRWGCVLQIDSGNYTQTSTILLPIFNYQKTALECAAGASITYTGSGYWLDTYIQGGMSASGEQITISHCKVTGTSSAAGAVRLYPSNSPVVDDNLFTGFTNGDGATVAGANHVTFRGNVFSYNKNGVRTYGVKCLTSPPYTCSPTQSGASQGFAPNAIEFEENEFASNSQWGELDDQTQGMQVQALNNQYTGNVFEGNGTAGSSYGGVALDQSIGAVLHGNYFEGNPRNVVVGITACCNSIGTVIRDNYFTVGGSAPTQLNCAMQLTAS